MKIDQSGKYDLSIDLQKSFITFSPDFKTLKMKYEEPGIQVLYYNNNEIQLKSYQNSRAHSSVSTVRQTRDLGTKTDLPSYKVVPTK